MSNNAIIGSEPSSCPEQPGSPDYVSKTFSGVKVCIRPAYYHGDIKPTTPIDEVIAHTAIVDDEYRLRLLKESGFYPKSFLDLGANIGAVSALVKHLWPQCRCTLVEAVSGHLAVAREILKEYKDIDYLVAFAGEEEPAGRPWVSIVRKTVPVVTMPEISRMFGPFCLVKTDIEGSERAVFRQSKMLDIGKVITGEWHGAEMLDAIKQSAAGSHWLQSTIHRGCNDRGLFHAIQLHFVLKQP